MRTRKDDGCACGAPAEAQLFTTWIACGEGNATKRARRVCGACLATAVDVLDRIGMRIAWEGDGNLQWDAHVRLEAGTPAAAAHWRRWQTRRSTPTRRSRTRRCACRSGTSCARTGSPWVSSNARTMSAGPRTASS